MTRAEAAGFTAALPRCGDLTFDQQERVSRSTSHPSRQMIAVPLWWLAYGGRRDDLA
jgi:hypothetical protein